MDVKEYIEKDQLKLGKDEALENETCPKCGGLLVTNYGPDISCTFCVDCDYNEYDYY